MSISSKEFQGLSKGKMKGKMKAKAPKLGTPKPRTKQRPLPQPYNPAYMYGPPVHGM
jgi:hypothetical protein